MTEKISEIQLERIPVGIKYLKENEMPENFDTIENPKVRSFCDGLRLLHENNYPNGVIITLDKIKACKWCPVGLGLKTPQNGIEKKIEPLFEELNKGIHIFNLTDAVREPDIVSVIAKSENAEQIINTVGLENFTKEYIDELTFSAISQYTDVEFPSKHVERKRKRHLRSIKLFQWLFASKLISNRVMNRFLTFMLKQYPFSRMMDPILRQYSTGMSFCYSTSAIPLTTQKANVVFAETGGIGWGGISKDDMIFGMPYSLYKTFESKATIVSNSE